MPEKTIIRLSERACSLWGKTDGEGGRLWLPLYVHMADSIGIAERLWDEWLPEGTRRAIIGSGDASTIRTLFLLLAGWHDIGKATPVFQAKPCRFGASYSSEGYGMSWKPKAAGLRVRDDLAGKRRPTHSQAGQAIVGRLLGRGSWGWKRRYARSVKTIIGNHHGRPLSADRDNEMAPGGQFEIEMGYEAANEGQWQEVQDELLAFVCSVCGATRLEQMYLPPQSASLMTGLLIMTDWIASNQELFPLEPSEPWEDGSESPGLVRGGVFDCTAEARRVDAAWRDLDVAPAWHGPLQECGVEDLYAQRFSLPAAARPRPVQKDALRIARDVEDPGIIVIEAPMGEGKTEAALAAAEALAERTGRGGVCVALPTMATTDAMFGRVHDWLSRLPKEGGARTVCLAHGKARLNEEYQGIVRSSWGSHSEMGVDVDEDGRDDVEVSTWMTGRKRGMLSNFVVCTVDQVLMGALAMKHLPLRQLALANKVVVIDECHAYDAYMNNYLRRVLQWLGSFGTPVVLLSATLPPAQRNEMVDAYLDGRSVLCYRYACGCRGDADDSRVSAASAECDAYPLITYTSGQETRFLPCEQSGRSQEVEIRLMDDGVDSLAQLLGRLLEDGGCAGVICDTVGRSQEVAAALRGLMGDGDVILSHARFTDIDRMDNEKKLRELLGPKATRANGLRPHRLVVVGTQVLEQSLDIDFDVLVSDVAPVDLLMQRIGRLHRHNRDEGDRPKSLQHAICFVRGVSDWVEDVPRFDRGVLAVYEEAGLFEALSVLGLVSVEGSCEASLPSDIARLVHEAYRGFEASSIEPSIWADSYGRACSKRRKDKSLKNRRASACLLQDVREMCRNSRSLSDWYQLRAAGGQTDSGWGPRAVRDTQESVEVLLAERRDNQLRLLPWVASGLGSASTGAVVSTSEPPDEIVAKTLSQCSVRLPMGLCGGDSIEGLIDELEQICSPLVGHWQESPWLAGRLVLPLAPADDGSFSASLVGEMLTYSREDGLVLKESGDQFSRIH